MTLGLRLKKRHTGWSVTGGVRSVARWKLPGNGPMIWFPPGEEGKWFATAKDLKLYDMALELANRTPCDPKTLTRAARDYVDTGPAFVLGTAMAAFHWLSEGWGCEVPSADVVEAYDRAMDAASRLNKVDEVTDQIRQLVESNESASVLFVR